MKKNAPLKLNPVSASKDEVINLKPYIPGKPIQEIKKRFGMDRVVKLASNECPVTMPEGIRKALVDAIENVKRYPDGHSLELRHALAEDLNIPAEATLVGNGAEECLNMIGQAFINPGDESIIPDPSFDSYRITTEFMGGEPVFVPLSGDHIDLDGLLERVSDRTKIIWICSPNNPTGTVISKPDFDAFLDRLAEGIVVVFDQAYWEYIVSRNPANSCDYLENDARVIGVRTFSKVFGLAGLRVGYLIAHPSVIDVIAKVKLSFNVNVLAQVAARAALREKQFKKDHLEMTRTEREKLIAAFKERGIVVRPTETNFIMIPLPFNGDELFERLLPEGMIVRPGSVFGMPNAIRLSIGNPEENRFFLETFDQAMASITN